MRSLGKLAAAACTPLGLGAAVMEPGDAARPALVRVGRPRSRCDDRREPADRARRQARRGRKSYSTVTTRSVDATLAPHALIDRSRA